MSKILSCLAVERSTKDLFILFSAEKASFLFYLLSMRVRFDIFKGGIFKACLFRLIAESKTALIYSLTTFYLYSKLKEITQPQSFT